jgi:ABC-2 type transport system permease protein
MMLSFSALAGLVVFGALRGLGSARPEALAPMLSAAATGLGLLAALSPLLNGMALAESHDVSRLMHYPVSSSTLAVASLVSNLTRPSALVQLPVLVAAAAAVSWSLLAFPLALAGMFLSWLLIVSGAHIAALVLHGLSRRRRLHDLFLALGLVLGFMLSVAPFLLLIQGPGSVVKVLTTAAWSGALVLSPFGWGVRAAVHAGQGEALPFLGFTALAGLAQTTAMGAEAALIERIHRGELDLSHGKTRRFRARMAWPGPLGALVEKDLRSAWRDPALRTALAMGLVGPLLLFFVLSRGGSRFESHAPLFLMASFVGVSTFGANGLGLERRGLTLLLSFPIARWRVLAAKNVAMVCFRLPGLLGLLFCAVAFASPLDIPGAVTIVTVTLLFCAAADNFMSILFPMPAPAPGQNPYAAGSQRGFGGALVAMAFLLAALVASAPFVFLAWLPALAGLLWLSVVTLPLALGGALAIYGMLVVGAGSLLERREGDLLEYVLGEG